MSTDQKTTNANTLIWSDEHGAYWRPEARGYTTDATKAGVWTYAEAARMTNHCGPEKRVRLMLQREVRREAAAIALWHRFAPGSQLAWEDETHQEEYRLAVDAVKEAIHAE